MYFTTALTSLLCAYAASVSALATPRAESASSVEEIQAKAASLSIDLAKVPAWEAVPELDLTPIGTGEGLPTLQELNLTWNDLLTSPLETRSANEDTSSLNSLAKRQFPATCYMTTTLSRPDAVACGNYLNSLGTTPCQVQGNGATSVFCWQGNAKWTGHSVRRAFESSHCSDVARGGQWVLDQCIRRHSSGLESFGNGANAAWGNGNLVVSIERA